MAQVNDRATTGGAIDSRKGFALAVLCAAMFLDALDTSVVGVALPSIQEDLGLSNTSLQWVVSAYTVAFGGFLLFGGRAADLLGRRRTFLIAMGLFAAASLAGSLVSEGPLLVASRIVKGIAAAFTAPAALSIITTTYREGAERNRAIAIYGATAASGYSLGLVLSGLLTTADWRLVFFVPSVLAAAVMIATPFALKADRPSGERRSYDAGGTILVTAGALLLVFGLVQIPHDGLFSATALLPLGGAVLLLILFVVVENRHPDPAVPLRLFRSWTRSSANVLALAFASSSIGWAFAATLYLQEFLGHSALRTGIELLPYGLTVVVVANFVTGRLVSAIGIRSVAVLGMTAQTLGIGLWIAVGTDARYALILMPGLILHGIGNGLTFSTMNIAGVSGVKNEEQGIASGMIIASFQIGSGIGAAAISGVLTAATNGTSDAARVDGFQVSFLTAAIFGVVGILISWLGLRTSTPKAAAPATEARPEAAASPTPS
ncbi:MFS transporter [Streptomyces sp. MP131-18]|uniref:MFS transporter n=1 Tax=Streptomyces sp. MP131-18 TaxID=1857892 RepID=UPI0009CFA496|nr:MFS transporter [Streptomyces sp. MP131-18]ONK14138.1 Spectinomycin tetracycline efflux pump [Streptomyces sp. MP131-18]